MGWCRRDLEMGGGRDPHLATCLVGCAGNLRRRSTLLCGVADPSSRSTGVGPRTAAFERLARRTRSILLGAVRRLRRGPHSALSLDGEQIVLERLQHLAAATVPQSHSTA